MELYDHPIVDVIDQYVDQIEAARSLLSSELREYARRATVDYSAAHPRRRVTFCSCMGCTTLHVETKFPALSGAFNGEYQFDGNHRHAPEFVRHLQLAEDSVSSFSCPTGDIRLECLGGVIVVKRRIGDAN